MTNELATTNNQSQAFDFFNPVQFETMQRVCKMFSSSELVPDMYKTSDKNPLEKAMANCMIAIEMAQRIGASPLMIMQNMVIIYGRPSWSSKFLIATVNTCGRFNPLQYRITSLGKVGKVEYTEYTKKWIDGTNGSKGYYKNDAKTTIFDGSEIDNLVCVAFSTQKGSESVLESAPVSIELAIQEGWYQKAGSKWKTMTKQMLMYRAASFWTSAYAPELSMGMKTDDEIRDIEDIEYVDVTHKVAEEIKSNANGQTINIDQPVISTAKNEGTKKPEEVKTPPPSATQTGSASQKSMPGF